MRLFLLRKVCCAATVGTLFNALAYQKVLGQKYTSGSPVAESLSSSASNSFTADAVFEEGTGAQAAPSVRGHSLLNAIGVDLHVGVNGIGGDIALPVAEHFNLRLGGQYFTYSDSFAEDGANIT